MRKYAVYYWLIVEILRVFSNERLRRKNQAHRDGAEQLWRCRGRRWVFHTARHGRRAKFYKIRLARRGSDTTFTWTLVSYRFGRSQMNEYVFMAVVLVGATVLAAYARWDYRRTRQNTSAKAKHGA